MLTQCPHCLTLFRIKPDHLKVAAGKVRCCQCNSVFNALQSLQESPVPFSRQDSSLVDMEPDAESTAQREAGGYTDAAIPQWQSHAGEEPGDEADSEPLEGDTSGFSDSDLSPSTSPLRMPSEVGDDIFEQDDGLETEPDYFAADTESQMSELLDQDSVSSLLLEEHGAEEKDLARAAEIYDFRLHQDDDPRPDEWSPNEGFSDSLLKDEGLGTADASPDTDSIPAFRRPGDTLAEASASGMDERVYAFESFEERPARRTRRLPWILGSLLLLMLLGVQMAWQWRERLVQYDTGRQLLSGICRVAGCTVPVLRATDRIVVQGRNLSTHPDKPGALLLQLRMVNTAAFDQPFPQLQLTLYNDKGILIARRSFEPEEYLPPDLQGDLLMPKEQPVLVEMELRDPGKEVTGFTFDFY